MSRPAVSYYVDETRNGTFAVIERAEQPEGDVECVVGEYRFAEDAEEHLVRVISRGAA